MTELVFKDQNDQVLTTSLLVAEKFGKEHSDVLKAIDALVCKMTENQCEGYFADSSIEIQHPNGGIRHSRVVVMNRDGFTLLAMGYTGVKALRLKNDFYIALVYNRHPIIIQSPPDRYPIATRSPINRKKRLQIFISEYDYIK